MARLIDEQTFKQLDDEYTDLKRKVREFEKNNRDFLAVKIDRENEALHHYILDR